MQPDQLPPPPPKGDPTRGWQTLVRRDLPLCLLALSVWAIIWMGNKMILNYERMIANEKENTNQYARIVIELAKSGHSASDLLYRSNASNSDSLMAKDKADSN